VQRPAPRHDFLGTLVNASAQAASFTDELAKLQANPALLHNLIAQTLRYEPPVTVIPRIALEDFELHRHAVRQGQLVQLSIASANRDSAHYLTPVSC
jgi:cytochrome P450